jgi:hypothetical protein
MKCPYCDNEMKKGYIFNPRMPVYWYPENEKPGFTVFSAPYNGVKLSKFPLFRSAKAIAHYCDACKKIVIDENENPVD